MEEINWAGFRENDQKRGDIGKKSTIQPAKQKRRSTQLTASAQNRSKPKKVIYIVMSQEGRACPTNGSARITI